jgi:galactokinase
MVYKREAWGVAEVIVETPSHEGDLFNLSLDHAVKVVETYKSEVEEYLTRECSVCLEEALKTHNPLLKVLGGLINYQHVLLRDMYDVSTPGLEEIRRRALEAGAIGVKISGAGLGGALFAIVEDEIIGERVARETSRTAAGAWLVKIDVRSTY